MSAIAKRSRDSKPAAVIRSYQPIRIERELLVQVFDLAERGLADGSASAGGKQVAADPRASDMIQHDALDQCADRRVNGVEGVV
ncbi:hypothetical protein [Blastopirellula marina]|nr:hypothetical protein [Blastopirellula marina]